MRPSIFRGLWCRCPERHHQEAGYYVSVLDGTRAIRALGPFREHNEALARVEDVNREVQARWNPDGRAAFYAFGTCAVLGNARTPGKLNAVLLPTPARRHEP